MAHTDTAIVDLTGLLLRGSEFVLRLPLAAAATLASDLPRPAAENRLRPMPD